VEVESLCGIGRSSESSDEIGRPGDRVKRAVPDGPKPDTSRTAAPG
jgi:hypothetical protein